MMTAWSGSSSASNAALAGALVGTSSTTHRAPMTTWPTQPPAPWSWRKLAPLIRSGFENGKRRRRRRSNAELAPWSKKRKAIAVLADKDNSRLLPRMRDLIEDLRAAAGWMTDAEVCLGGGTRRSVWQSRRTSCAMCGRLSLGKGFLDVMRSRSVRPCVRPVGAARIGRWP